LIAVNQTPDAVGNAIEVVGINAGLQRRGNGALGFRSWMK
jgi:hypothetical protein